MNLCTILSAFMLFTLLFQGVNLFLISSKEKFEFFNKHKSKFSILSLLFSVFHGGIAIAAILQVFESYGLKWFYLGGFFLGLGAILCPMLLDFAEKKSRQEKYEKFNLLRPLVFLFRTAFVLVMLELFVFNFNSFHITDATTPYFPDASASESVTNVSYSNGQYVSNGSGYCSIVLKAPGTKVNTMTIDAVSNQKAAVNLEVDFSDESNTSTKLRSGLCKEEIIQNNVRSQTFPTFFSGIAGDLAIRFTVETDEVVTIRQISLNQPINFEFSVIRFFTLYLILFVLYTLYASEILRRPFKENQKLLKSVFALFTALIILGTIPMINYYRTMRGSPGIINDFAMTTGDQITKELVDAFEKGQVHLTDPVPADLEALENPYDWSQRIENNVSAKWDHLYYNGKYYSYYGIAPVVLLFLPYHFITGRYFPGWWSVFLFTGIGLSFLAMFAYSFIKKFFKHIPASFAIIALLLLQLGSGILFSPANPTFYEIAASCGFMFMVSGLYFLLKANLLEPKKISYWRLALSGVLLSFSVLSRPTLALYCIGAVILIGFGCYRLFKAQEKSKISVKLKYLACALVPFIVIGGVQLMYNYARFGSFTSFGIEYSLTINDFTRSQFYTRMVSIGIFNFLFAFPVINTVFPFTHSAEVNTLNFNGYYFVAQNIATSLFIKVLPLWSYLFGYRAFKLTRGCKNRLPYTVLFLFFCVLCPFIIMFSIWESGFIARYSSDFAWLLILGALIIAFLLYQNIKSESLKRMLSMLFVGSLFICFMFTVGQLQDYITTALNKNPEVNASILSFGRIFEFWR